MDAYVFVQTNYQDIVSRIISQLTLKEAVRLSTTSSKLRRAWIYHPNLYFDTSIVFGSSDRHKKVPSTKSFIDKVNFILSKHSGFGVNKLAVIFELRKKHAHDIDGWVSFAVTSKARAVTLNFSPYQGSHESGYNFPCHLFSDKNGSNLQVLQLNTVTLGPTPNFCGFANLTMLTLENVLVLGDLQLLPKCPILECLTIRMCSHLCNLHSPEPLARLKFLCVQDSAVDLIDLHAPNLTTFNYRGRFKVVIALHECLKLKTASIVSPIEKDLNYIFTGLPNGLPRVERLHVEVLVETQIFGFTHPLHKYINLRHLTMRIAYGTARRFGKNAVLQLAYILEAAPFLVDLHLAMSCIDLSEGRPARDVIMDRPHYNLKRACITGFHGNGGQIALVRFILRNAVTLEKMTIDPKGGIMDHMVGEDGGRRMIKKKIIPKDKNGVLVIL
uniref:At1g61320/AtMIF1 LRR domain-containing protein n=1 Tax=Leersia perrieri TaxID=77586 RepID=A0A0D9XVW6_9ORYZ